MDSNQRSGGGHKHPQRPKHGIKTGLEEALLAQSQKQQLSPTPGMRGMPSPLSPASMASPSSMSRSGKNPLQSPSYARSTILPSPALTSSTIGPNDTRYSQLFATRKGRRYHRDSSLAYPLPCDVPELHRQTLRQLMLTSVFGAPFCSPQMTQRPPKRVLDIGCGTGIWSSQCHEYFSKLGHKNVEFIGLDIAPLAANLKEQGVNWIFVQHDLRTLSLPFADETFDFVFIKDLSLVIQTNGQYERIMEEYMRILRSGGVLEMWECKQIPAVEMISSKRPC
jgi:hypothetical protein